MAKPRKRRGRSPYLPDWQHQTVPIAFRKGKRPVRAMVFGDWCVHDSANFFSFRVSHVPSGKALAVLGDGLELWDAVRIARALDERLPTGVVQDWTDPDDPEAWVIAEVVRATFAEGLSWS
jgi:hypothetical protein